MELQTPIKEVGDLYRKYASRLEKLGIKTLEDFLYHIPFRYQDYSITSKIGQVQAGETVTIRGTVVEIKNEYTKSWKRLQKAKVQDETATIDVIWFNQPYLINVIRKGDNLSLSGKVDWYLHKIVLQSPEYEILNNSPTIHTGRLVPIYPETRGVSSKWLRRQIYKIIKDHSQNLIEYLPDSIAKGNDLIGLQDAFEQIHFPNAIKGAQAARRRLAFDELFFLQLGSIQRRFEWGKNLKGTPFSIARFKKNIEEFWAKLPFTLTNAQQRAVRQIFADLASKKPMNRLLEGDVGSGKTVVAAIAMYLAHLNDLQSVLMAPTEILAHQHFNTTNNLLSPLGVRVSLLTGSKKINPFDKLRVVFDPEAQTRRDAEQSRSIKNQKSTHSTSSGLSSTLRLRPEGMLSKVEASKIKSTSKNSKVNEKTENDILVGTHAVLSKKVNFDNLGLVVIDEQQRFGVEQRAQIKQKGKNPHLLTMTATPIPRTVALTLYGDLDLSYLDEMPKGRKRVKTWLVSREKRSSAYQWIADQIKKTKSQAFIICPFIEESESMQTVKAATKEYERLTKDIFLHFKLGLLHGKLKAKEKDKVLQDFRDKKTEILVTTPVVEVGIDIKNATIILIEASERFGLAQLHQLRGRVGRGDKQSYCLLFTESKAEQTVQRLKAMETMHSGAGLAELDLKLRGPGDLYGTMQHGLQTLKIASFSDFKLVEQTKKEAEKIFPELSKYPLLLEKLNSVTIKNISPD